MAITVSTDFDPPFFHTDMSAEYAGLHRAFGWEQPEFDALAQTGLRAAFCDDSTRARLAQTIGACMTHPDMTLIDHPLVQHKLSLMRDLRTPGPEFRRLLREIALLLTYEATRDLPITPQRIDTPLTAMDAPMLAGPDPAVVSILRAGNGLLDGVLDVVPTAKVGVRWASIVTRKPSARSSITTSYPRTWMPGLSLPWTQCWPPAILPPPRLTC